MATRFKITVTKYEDKKVKKNLLVKKTPTAIKETGYNKDNVTYIEEYATVEVDELSYSEILEQTVDGLDMARLIRAINGLE